jgi:hypothetical protein
LRLPELELLILRLERLQLVADTRRMLERKSSYSFNVQIRMMKWKYNVCLHVQEVPTEQVQSERRMIILRVKTSSGTSYIP